MSIRVGGLKTWHFLRLTLHFLIHSKNPFSLNVSQCQLRELQKYLIHSAEHCKKKKLITITFQVPPNFEQTVFYLKSPFLSNFSWTFRKRSFLKKLWAYRVKLKQQKMGLQGEIKVWVNVALKQPNHANEYNKNSTAWQTLFAKQKY